ncbi:MAG: class I SAM-dependent methyltransferase [Candidatus Omnitrophota bacterium]
MFTVAKRLPPSANILEIGCYLGRSTASFASGCVGTNKRVYSIDIFGGLYQDVINDSDLREAFGSDFFEKWRRNMKDAGVADYVLPLKGDSKNIAQIWRAPIHLLFIDGSHVYDDIIADFNNFFTYVVSGGIVAFHDVLPAWSGVYKVWHDVAKYQLVRIGNCDSICYGSKPSE